MIAQQALLLLSNSPAKAPSTSDFFNTLSKNQISYLSQLSEPLSTTDISQQGNLMDKCTATNIIFPSTNVEAACIESQLAVSNQNILSQALLSNEGALSQVLVSDQSVLSQTLESNDGDLLQLESSIHNVSVHQPARYFFEKPYEYLDLDKKVQLLPKPTILSEITNSDPSQLFPVIYNSDINAGKDRNSSISDQLAKKGQKCTIQKRRRPKRIAPIIPKVKKEKQKVVTRVLTFGSKGDVEDVEYYVPSSTTVNTMSNLYSETNWNTPPLIMTPVTVGNTLPLIMPPDVHSTASPKIIVTENCDKDSPAGLLHAKLCQVNSATKHISNPFDTVRKYTSVTTQLPDTSFVSPTSHSMIRSSDKVQKFRITGNTISTIAKIKTDVPCSSVSTATDTRCSSVRTSTDDSSLSVHIENNSAKQDQIPLITDDNSIGFVTISPVQCSSPLKSISSDKSTVSNSLKVQSPLKINNQQKSKNLFKSNKLIPANPSNNKCRLLKSPEKGSLKVKFDFKSPKKKRAKCLNANKCVNENIVNENKNDLISSKYVKETTSPASEGTRIPADAISSCNLHSSDNNTQVNVSVNSEILEKDESKSNTGTNATENAKNGTKCHLKELAIEKVNNVCVPLLENITKKTLNQQTNDSCLTRALNEKMEEKLVRICRMDNVVNTDTKLDTYNVEMQNLLVNSDEPFEILPTAITEYRRTLETESSTINTAEPLDNSTRTAESNENIARIAEPVDNSVTNISSTKERPSDPRLKKRLNIDSSEQQNGRKSIQKYPTEVERPSDPRLKKCLNIDSSEQQNNRKSIPKYPTEIDSKELNISHQLDFNTTKHLKRKRSVDQVIIMFFVVFLFQLCYSEKQ